MQRRDLVKLSPLALSASFAGHAIAQPRNSSSADGFFNVRRYGATGDGKTVDTPAINGAIRAIAAGGGGTLFFPAGTFVCFTIRLMSNVCLFLSQGCTILAADSPKPGETTGYDGGVYDPAGPAQLWEQYQDYGHNHWPNSLFFGENLNGVSIVGPGLIHGKGLSFGQGNTRGPYAGFTAEQPGVGNKAISLKNCCNVLLRDFSILKGGHFGILATGVDNMTIDNLVIDTDRDGIDIDCCRNVRVSNCTVNSPWDDGICPKSSFALGYVRSTDNVTIANNYVTGAYELGSVIDGTWKKQQNDLHPHQGRIKCGTESNGGFRNITITGNVMEGSKGIALETSDGAFVEDVAITGNTMRDVYDAPLFLRLNRRNRGPAETSRLGTLRRVVISDIVSSNSNSTTSSIFSGIPSNLIEDVKVSNCFFGHKGLPTNMTGDGRGRAMPDWTTIHVPEQEAGYPELGSFGPTPCQGFFIRHLRNLEMSHVEIAPAATDPRPAFWLEDAHRVDFFAITAPKQRNFSLHNVTDLRILWSRAAADTNLPSATEQTV